MTMRMRRRRLAPGKNGSPKSAAHRLWQARINTGAFALTLVLLSGQQFSGTMAREYNGLEQSPIPPQLQLELPTITAATFTLPSVPPPPPPDYQPGDIAAWSLSGPALAAEPLPVPTVARKVSTPAKRTVRKRRTIFGAIEFKTRPNQIGTAWNRALQRMDNELPLYAFCEQGALECPKNFNGWRKLVASSRHLEGLQLIQTLNSGINGLVKHREDTDTYGTSDHWASPLEFLDAGGDCEDYTILKYASLIELGIDERDLRIVVVKDMRRNRGHAVLSVRTPKGEMILDSLSDAVRRDTAIGHYKPVYSLNRHHHYLHIAARMSKRG